jgi:hypothetical protein
MGLLNHTTKIAPEQTISEIQMMLSRHGVTAMMTEYDGPHVSAVSFQIKLDGKPIGFKLPCNWKAVVEIMRPKHPRNVYDAKKKAAQEEALKQQAIRTAWRIIHTWVKAQLALVEVNMVTVPQVFLPYMKVSQDQTLYEKIITDPKFLLSDGS